MSMGKFIDPFTDWGFKRIFGQEAKGKGRMNARRILNVGFTHNSSLQLQLTVIHIDTEKQNE